MTVVIQGPVDSSIGEVDALLYLKRKGEHLLAVKVAKYRNNLIRKEEFIEELAFLVDAYNDNLVDKIMEHR